MNKKGFTLVELLAVITILGIIALISIPIVTKFIDNSREGALARSAENYIRAVKNEVMYQAPNDTIEDGTYKVMSDGNLCKGYINNSQCTGIKINVETEGKRPNSGQVLIENGEVVYVSTTDEDIVTYIEIDSVKLAYTEDGIYEDYQAPLYKEKLLAGAYPELSGLTAVVYNGTDWVVADTTAEWYNYSEQNWANAVSLKNNIKKDVGDKVDVSSEVLAMFVWIPRFKYVISTGTGAREINIVFEGKTTTKSTGNAVGSNYYTHPAFTFGSKELNGFWVGKFETSTNTNSICYTSPSADNCNNTNQSPRILPNVKSLTYQDINNQFKTAQKFGTSTYGMTKVDAHMMKNSEWGAVAYLSNSKYGNSIYTGVNKEIYQNKSSLYLTGNSNGTPSNNNARNMQCEYDDIVNRGNGLGSCGGGASTTGNISGVYDMSGGAWEHVMGHSGNEQTSLENSGFTSRPDEKYYNKYWGGGCAPGDSSNCLLGVAFTETDNWYGDLAVYAYNNYYSWYSRGGANYDNTQVGIFSHNSHTGAASGSSSFRVVVTQK